MNADRINFGTGGWRGIIGETFTKANLQKVIFSVLDEIGDGGVLVAKDRRFLSDEAMVWALEVLCAYNKKVYIIEDSTPTPTMMHAVMHNNYDLGIMITASHNPAKYNGIKIITEGGRDATIVLTSKLEKIANTSNPIKTVTVLETMYTKIYPNADYVEGILRIVDVEKIRKQHFRVAVDMMHSVSYRLIPMLLGSVGVEFDMIRDRRDPLFDNEVPNPSKQTLQKLDLMMKKNTYAIGIATDADGDRIGLLDECGNYIHPNTTLAVLYKYLLDRGKRGPAVRNIATTHLLDEIAKDFQQEVYEEAVGFKNISESMNESNALIGGESSGGMTTKDHIHGKDGIYISILVLEMMSFYQLPLSKIIANLKSRYGKYYFFEKEYYFDEITIATINDNLYKRYQDKNNTIVNQLDGIKVIYPDGSWLSFRKSGTENLCRVFVEAKSQKRINEILIMFEMLIKKE